MPSPERKAAERIVAAVNEARKFIDRAPVPMVSIIADEHAPMRAMMEKMAAFIGRVAGWDFDWRNNRITQAQEGASKVLSDYTAMKAGWEAEDVLNTTKA